MPSTRRRGSPTAVKEQQQPRKNPRRRGRSAAVVNYREKRSKDDEDSNDSSEAEILSEPEEEEESSDDEVVVLTTRRSSRRVAKKETPDVPSTTEQRRVSTRTNKVTSNMQELSDGDDDEEENEEEDSDGLEDTDNEVSLPPKKKNQKSPTKSPARRKNNRLSIESLAQSDYVDEEEEEEEDDEESIYSDRKRQKNKKTKKKQEKKEKETKPKDDREFEPFTIKKIIAGLTLPRSDWKELCQAMQTSEIDVGSRWEQEPDDGASGDVQETRYLIKWSDLSYLHCSWETEEDLELLVKGSKGALTNFLKRCNEEGKIFDAEERNDGEYMDPEWTEIDRVLGIHFPEGYPNDYETEAEITHDDVGIILDPKDADYDGGLGRQFLILWGNRPYSDCSWEFERDLILADVAYKHKSQEYMDRCNQKSKRTRQREHAAGKAQFQRLEKLFGGEGDDSQVEEGATRFQKALEEHKYPDGGQLRDYQAEGVAWLIANYVNKRSCILADEMGLGKTIQVAAFLDYLASRLHRHGPFLVLVPLSTIGNWKKECGSWLSGLNTIIYHGSAKDREMIRELEMVYESDQPKTTRSNELYLRKCSSARSSEPGNPWKADVVITTPELLIADDFVELTVVKWECLIVDEAQKLKNFKSKIATNLRDTKFKFLHKILLTGTPIQNNMEEFFAILNFCDPMKFPNCEAFMEKYGDMKETETLDELHTELEPYILRRKKEDVEKSVPPKEETIVEVELTIAQKQYYRALYEKNVKFLHKNKRKSRDGPSLNNLALQLRKCCNHLFMLNGIEEEFVKKELAKGEASEVDLLVRASGKLVLLDKLLPRLKENGHRLLVFSQFKNTLNILEDYLSHREWTFERIDGSITGTRRQQAIERFQASDVDEKERPFIMLLSTRAGGVGINLTAADTCIIFDSDWNPQNDLQAQARCHRIGQTKDVKVYRLLTRSTYEQRMFKLASRKLGLDQAVLSGFEGGNDKGPTKEELELLLREGAYEILNEDKEGAEASSNDFIAQDIDTLLQRHSRVIKHEHTGTGSSAKGGKFSKAKFSSASPGRKSAHDKIDIDDPDFWKKMLGDPIQEEDVTEEVVGKRARTVNNYSEADQDKKFFESHDLEGDLEGESDEEDGDGVGDKERGDEGEDGDNDDESFEQGEESESEDDEDEVMILENLDAKPKAKASKLSKQATATGTQQPTQASASVPSRVQASNPPGPTASVARNAAASSKPETYSVTIPNGVYPGMQFMVDINGQRFLYTCPPNVGPGHKVQIETNKSA